ncbi:HNH endonuclease [Hwanghaeella sp.]|uniref:HNH endonuclease n=1 Tax=Hwanghaeella sp. TaxID=2605943 RepID=UPI003CCBE7E4
MKTAGNRIRSTAAQRIKSPAKITKAHYGSAEHKAWRADVVRRAQGRCERCSRKASRLFADHIREIEDGGDPLDRGNGQALCGSCHSIKTAEERARRHGVQ